MPLSRNQSQFPNPRSSLAFYNQPFAFLGFFISPHILPPCSAHSWGQADSSKLMMSLNHAASPKAFQTFHICLCSTCSQSHLSAIQHPMGRGTGLKWGSPGSFSPLKHMPQGIFRSICNFLWETGWASNLSDRCKSSFLATFQLSSWNLPDHNGRKNNGWERQDRPLMSP